MASGRRVVLEENNSTEHDMHYKIAESLLGIHLTILHAKIL